MRAKGLGASGLMAGCLVACALAPASASALSWSRAASIAPAGQSVSCASSSLCVAATGDGLEVSAAPLRGASSWHRFAPPASSSCPPPSGPTPGGYMCRSGPTPFELFAAQAVSCPTVTLCVAVGFDGQSRANEAFVSTDPTGDETAWTQVKLPTRRRPQSVSCSSDSVCVVAIGNGRILTSSNPANAGSWKTLDLYPYQPAPAPNGGVSCVVGLCAIASTGTNSFGAAAQPTVVTAAQPTGGPAAWNGDFLNGYADLTVTACASKRLCIAADLLGTIYATRRPASSNARWRPAPSTYPRGNPFSGRFFPPSTASCSPQGLCAVGKGGTVLTSSNPLGGHWSRRKITSVPFSISCATNALCVALDERGRVIVGS